MGITKNKLNYYLHKTLASTYGDIYRKQNKCAKENIDTNDVIQVKNENAYIRLQPLKDHSLPKKTKDCTNMLHSIESYLFNSITYKKFDKKKTPKNDIRTVSENNLAREYKCGTLNSIDKHNYNKKLNVQHLDDSEESVHSVDPHDDTNINIRCTNITDDENNNMELQSKNNKVVNQTKVKIIV